MGDHELSISVPLDNDGFLRRECPTCEREFKWRPTPDGAEGTAMPDGGYYCPYCRVQAPGDAWNTKAQVELAQNKVMTDIVGPELGRFRRNLRSMNRRGGIVQFDAKFDEPEPIDPLVEDDDMRQVEFTCHTNEPIKVVEEWDGPVFCLICSTSAPTV